MPVLVVVVREERAAEAPGVLDAAEALGECRAVLQGLELRLGVGVVVAHVRPGMCPTDAEERQQLGHLIGGHGRSPVAWMVSVPGVIPWRATASAIRSLARSPDS